MITLSLKDIELAINLQSVAGGEYTCLSQKTA